MNKLLSLIILAVLLPSAAKAVNITDDGVQKNNEMARLKSIKKYVSELEEDQNLQQGQVRARIIIIRDQVKLLSTAADNKGFTKVWNACERYWHELNNKLNLGLVPQINPHVCRRLFS